LDAFVQGRFPLQNLWYKGRSKGGARAAALDHRHDLILRATVERIPSRRNRLLTAAASISEASKTSDLSDVKVVILTYASATNAPDIRKNLFDMHAAEFGN